MEKVLKLENGITVTEGLCTCFKCSIKIKLIGYTVDKGRISDYMSITKGKVYKLIIEYGIFKYGTDYIVIDTPELTYYIYE